jgi:four helix bundle protein
MTLMVGKRDYRDLIVWQRAVELAPIVYGILRGFPRHEEFALCAQIRRACVSIAANVAEGQGRQTRKEFHQFLNVAKGSLAELHTLFVIAHRLEYIQAETLTQLEFHLAGVGRPLAGLISQIKRPSNGDVA